MLAIERFLPRKNLLLFSILRCNTIVATGRPPEFTLSRPHPRRDVSFLGPHGIGIDRGSGELRVPEPALQ